MTASAHARYDRAAIALHWLVALLVLGQIALGVWMLGVPKTPPGVRAEWFNLHKSFGMTIGLLALVRLAWRATHRPPPWPAAVPQWQRSAAATVHLLLYGCLLLMPLAGYLGSVYSGYPIRYFGLTLPAWGVKDESLKELASRVHAAGAALFVTLIAGHVLAALKHRLVDRDGVFDRMWPRRASPLAQGR